MSILPRWQKILRRLRMIATSVMLGGMAACQSSGLGVPNGLPMSSQFQQPVLSPNPLGEVMGRGNIRIALLVPKSAPGNAAQVASEIKNGASMAMRDFGNTSLQLVIKDTMGQPASAQSAAREAIAEGSSLVIGPLFAANVSAASGMTVPSGITVLAFSTDSSVARRGVYLLSFLPEDDTNRILNYAASIGKRSITAFLANNSEGAIRERILRQVAGTRGIAVQIVKYSRTSKDIEQAVKDSISLVQASDTIYIPEGGPVPNAILTGLSRNGVILKGKQVLGSGAWESVNPADAALNGALYPGRSVTKFNDFAARYQADYNTRPGVHAALGYDAITLVSELVRINGGSRAFSTKNLEGNQGFIGINGIFRLRPSGTTQRGLAIYQINNRKGQLLVPAPTSFARTGNF